MSITPFLTGRSFEPKTLQAMSVAFASACDTLRLRAGDDPAAARVAETVIKFAQRGIRNPRKLRRMTLKEFGFYE